MSDTIDTEQRSFHFERVLRASPDAVFDAWTVPDEISAWWDPDGRPLVSCTIDARPGGAFRFVNAGHSPPFEGTYEVVERPHRLVFDAMGARGTVTLQAVAAGTRMRVEIRSPSEEHFAAFLRFGVNTGTTRTFDNLEAYVRGRGERADATPA